MALRCSAPSKFKASVALYLFTEMSVACLVLVRCLLLLGLPIAILSQTYVSFDGASASSTYSAGAFSADQALSAGSGYWCRLRLHFHFTAIIAYVSVEVALSFNCLFVCRLQFWKSQFWPNCNLGWGSERSAQSFGCKA